MPQPTAADGSNFSLEGAPGSELSLDSLFADPSVVPAGDTTAQNANAPQPVAQPTALAEPFLKAGSSVYKTAEDAVQGISHKDALIEQLRGKYIETTGRDPITGHVVSAPQAAQPPERKSYVVDKKSFARDLAAAAQANDEEKYVTTYETFLNDYFAPVAPIIAGFAKQQAINKVAGEFKEFPAFVGSADYNSTLKAMPLLEQAITNAETNVGQSHSLDQLYRMAYLASQGARMAAQPTAPVVVQAAPAPRQTLSPSHTAPPSTLAARPDFTTPEGRKALAEQAVSKGIMDFVF